MKLLGKIVAGSLGWVFAGPLGLVLGVIFGHSLDSILSESYPVRDNPHQFKQADFINALFTVLGNIAKSDGRVSEAEIRYTREVMAKMGLTRAGARQAINSFNVGKVSAFKVGEVIAKLHEKVPPNHVLVQTLMENLIGMAYVDGPMTVMARTVLLQVCEGLGVSRLDFERLDAMTRARYDFYRTHRQQHQQHQQHQQRSQSRQQYYTDTDDTVISVSQAYEILEIKASATDVEVKKAYRKMMSRHHPDKLIAQGLSPEMIKLATSKTQRIKAAHDIIKKNRGI